MEGSHKRVKGVTVEKKVLYGNLAVSLGKQADAEHTHRWTVYVRGFNNEDISTYVSKVVFQLHESFAENVRTLSQPPYEVSETGWGEFEIVIKIHFMDPSEKPVTLYHPLCLYPREDSTVVSKKILFVEHYDEIIFNDPTEQFLRALQRVAFYRKMPTHTKDHASVENAHLQKLGDARTKIQSEMTKFRSLYKDYDDEARALRDEIQKLDEAAQAS